MAGVRFEDVDLLGALSRIVDLHTQHYKEDFDLDKELISKLAVSDRSEDKQLLWMSRPCGTYTLRERYSIIYSSRTGNTRLLAEAIRESLPADLCNHFGTDEAGAVESEKLYVGFWTDKGTADEAALALLKRLKYKKIFLFGTAGFGESEAYFQKVLDRVKESIDESNSIIGTYMCQGKMPMAVRERYEKMKQQPNPAPNLDGLIRNFDRALTHPDDHDLEELKQAVRREGGQLI